MLPLGRKNARKCSECDITCHANCAHLVPDFCGMSMETANELLRNWRDINRARGDKAQVRPPPRQYTEQIHTTSPSLDSTIGAVDRMKIGVPEISPPPADAFGRPASVPPPSDRYPQDPRYYQQQQPPQPQPQQYQQQPPQIPPFGQPSRPPPGARVPIPPGYSQDAMQGRAQSPYDAGPSIPGSDVGYSGGYTVC